MATRKVIVQGNTILDLTDATRTARDIASGKTAYGADGSKLTGTGGGGKNAQTASGLGRIASTAYTAVTGQSITVAKSGTYDVYWVGYRSSTSGTNGSQLYIGSNSYGSAVTTFDGTYTNWQIVHLSNVSLTKDQVVTVRARSRGTSYYMYVADFTIIEA